MKFLALVILLSISTIIHAETGSVTFNHISGHIIDTDGLVVKSLKIEAGLLFCGSFCRTEPSYTREVPVTINGVGSDSVTFLTQSSVHLKKRVVFQDFQECSVQLTVVAVGANGEMVTNRSPIFSHRNRSECNSADILTSHIQAKIDQGIFLKRAESGFLIQVGTKN